MLKIYDLTIEYKHEPLGLDEIQPRFGWKLDSNQQDCKSCRAGMLCGIPARWRVRRAF